MQRKRLRPSLSGMILLCRHELAVRNIGQEPASMRLTRQTNYAMRILMYCASNSDRLSRIPEIANAYSVSQLFLFKILQPLVEAGLIETVRGRNGGVRLGRPAQKISLLDVAL